MKTIIIGIGNPILGDDGVGIHVVRMLKKSIEDDDNDMVLEEASTGGMNLLDMILGHDRAVLVDSICSDELEIGEVVVVRYPSRIGSAHSSNPHDVSFPEAIALAENMGEERIPREIWLVGINIIPVHDFSEGLSREAAGAVETARDRVLEVIGR